MDLASERGVTLQHLDTKLRNLLDEPPIESFHRTYQDRFRHVPLRTLKEVHEFQRCLDAQSIRQRFRKPTRVHAIAFLDSDDDAIVACQMQESRVLPCCEWRTRLDRSEIVRNIAESSRRIGEIAMSEVSASQKMRFSGCVATKSEGRKRMSLPPVSRWSFAVFYAHPLVVPQLLHL